MHGEASMEFQLRNFESLTHQACLREKFFKNHGLGGVEVIMFKTRSRSLASFLFLPTFRSLTNYRFCLNFRFFPLISYEKILPIGLEKNLFFHSTECQSNPGKKTFH